MKKLALLLFAALVVCTIWFLVALRPVRPENAQMLSATVAPGDSLSVIAEKLADADLIRSPSAFRIYARISGLSTRLQAGTFALNRAMSSQKIIETLVSGKSQEFFVTIPEGYTVADIDALMAKKGLGKPGDILDCAFHCDFSTFDFLPVKTAGSREEGIGSRLEGYLFPETYAVSPGDYVPKFFLERMLGTFRKRIVEGYTEEIKASGKSLADLVNMASLVESESRHDEERAVVAGILWKRLKSRIVLGVDATTRYVLQKPTETLTKSDVETDSKYNTRRTQGLPPSPIANAGESSFKATLKPSDSTYWYYLHGNDGAIHYAVTNDEHNVNRAKYLR